MNFVGQRAVVVGNGALPLQPHDSPGFIALAFFLPVIVFLIAFCIVGPNDRVSIVCITIGAVVAAAGVCSKRYVGQIGITNYPCEYQVGYAVGSAIILVVSFVLGLLSFFTFKASWHSTWWKRGLCAALIATAICSSNWLASVGEQLRLRRLSSSTDSLIYENAVIISVFVLVCRFSPRLLHIMTKLVFIRMYNTYRSYGSRPQARETRNARVPTSCSRCCNIRPGRQNYGFSRGLVAHSKDC